MAELILLKPLFAGTDHIDQLTKIFDVVGTPAAATLDDVCEPCTSFLHSPVLNDDADEEFSSLLSDARDYINKLPTKPKQDYQKLFGYKYESGSKTPKSGVSPEGIALLDRLLSFDHRKRPNAVEALGKDSLFHSSRNKCKSSCLADPYFESLHDPMEEPSAEPLVDEHQDATYPTHQWKSKSKRNESFNSKAEIFCSLNDKITCATNEGERKLFLERLSSDHFANDQ